jgi:SpoVK/Ycf46/Vps4 family AAA+-type ATPase
MTKRKVQDDEVNFDVNKRQKKIPPKLKIEMTPPVNNIKDLIEIGKSLKFYKNIDVVVLWQILPYLEELESMIGMKNIKQMIIDLIFFRLQNFEDSANELWHLVIQGTPGSGKTEIARIIGKIYYGLGIIKKDKFTLAKRSELIGKYLGHTAKLTQEVFDNACGGILFIDEAYSLGNPEQRDSFSKECIDTLCEALSDHKQELMVIIAGYENELNDCFFNYNQGLDSRFTWRFKIDKYNGEELYQIFVKKIKENDWSVENEIEASWFQEKHDSFPFFGRDIETLLTKIKITHSKRVFCLDSCVKKKITLDDLNNGLEMFINNSKTIPTVFTSGFLSMYT